MLKKKQNVRLAFGILAATAVSIWAQSAYSFCVETGTGVRPGVLSAGTCSRLLSELNSQGSGTFLFTVQQAGGFYGKVCNQSGQISHFMHTYASGRGSWACQKVASPCADSQSPGVHRISRSGNGYEVCVWKAA
jgi:hypothetical protein